MLSVFLVVAFQSPAKLSLHPLADRVVMLHYDEGDVLHHGHGQKKADDVVRIDALDPNLADRPESYRIVSADDPAFRAPKAPAKVFRKSKGTDFAWYVDKWENNRAVNTRPDHTKEHWLYLVLDRPLSPGKTYTASLAGKTATLLYRPTESRSEAVHVNLLGYSPEAPERYAYVYHWMGSGGGLDPKPLEGRPFSVIEVGTGRKRFEGKLAFRGGPENQETFHVSDSPPHGNFLKAGVLEADLSAFSEPGKYVVSVEGVGCSWPFEIRPDVLREAYTATARALYHNRSGIELKKPFADFPRPAPHHPKLTPGFVGKLKYTTVPYQDWGSEGGDKAKLEAGFKGDLEAWGWYQDAGDWDSYVSHLRVPTELLFAYELRPENFRDGDLNLPESGNGVPDILDEAAWLPRFCHRLRQELLRKKWGTGGIGLRVAGDAFGSDLGPTELGRGSHEDTDRIWAASGEDAVSTFRYAAVAAHLQHALNLAKAKDPQGVDWLKEARESYAWALRNQRAKDEGELKPIRAYAAAALFRLTGEKPYEDRLRLDTADVKANSETWESGVWGPGVYALTDRTRDPELLARLNGAVLHTADQSALVTGNKRLLRWGGLWSFPMLVGQQTTPWMLEAMIGWGVARKEGDEARAKRTLARLYTTADYFLGTNALNQTWITGVGERFPDEIFHLDAWYVYGGKYPKGYIPYSPWRKEKDWGQGPWDQHWADQTVFPKIDEWPGNERWFSNRNSPMGSEFTVHQNIGPAAAFYGFLGGKAK